jgi:hypothetical protein
MRLNQYPLLRNAVNATTDVVIKVHTFDDMCEHSKNNVKVPHFMFSFPHVVKFLLDYHGLCLAKKEDNGSMSIPCLRSKMR